MVKKVVSAVLALAMTIAVTTSAYATENVLDSITAGVARKVKASTTSSSSSSSSSTKGSPVSSKNTTSSATKQKSSDKMQLVETVMPEEKKSEDDTSGETSEEAMDRDDSSSSDDEDSSGRDLCVADVDDAMNVRAEASEDSSVVGYLYKDCVGEILERGDGWTRIRSGLLEGWAKNEFLMFDDSARKKAEESMMDIAVVNADGLRIRAEASEDAEVKAVLAIDDEVDVLETESEWTKISYQDGTEGEDTGYVSNEYITIKTTYRCGETLEQVRDREERSKAAREESDKKKDDNKAEPKNESSEKPAETRTEAPATTNTGAVEASVDDETLLAALIQCECNGPYEAQLAVGAVVVNRAKGGYGSISNAIYAPYQFGPASSGKLKLTLQTGAVSATAKQAAHDAISGVSNVGNARYFRNVSSGHAGIVIGNHVYW
ncbi:MAG: SH3 domain-containing protein [Lachnospiraceae bacterium]|nr:SH3 domain-containing protein [Lachnospiraceae bacterium]